MTKEELNELEVLETAATPSPWCAHTYHGTSVWTGAEYDSSGIEPSAHLLNATSVDLVGIQNVELVVAARNALPELLASARRLLELEGALLFLKGGRSPDVYIERAKERGWKGTP